MPARMKQRWCESVKVTAERVQSHHLDLMLSPFCSEWHFARQSGFIMSCLYEGPTKFPNQEIYPRVVNHIHIITNITTIHYGTISGRVSPTIRRDNEVPKH